MYEVAEESERDPHPALHTSQGKEWDRMEKEVEEDGEERDPSLNTSQEKEKEKEKEDCPSDQEVEVRETEPAPPLNTSRGEFSDEEISTNKEKHWRLGSEDPNDTLVFDFSEMESALLMLESCTAGRKHRMEIVEKNMREAEQPSIG
ncbi:hypothetical protein AOXY_G27757 [Acipenser oxyrinchus oxyrinchus]|uniref:Uncharacterized protein n=1 Tax=Acipenser oxyrinchus oxyrinchus TaxID=40147 RepID=A0AAD8CS72_ACIOX|nr:hypothetical protein AOXY_G27757 [Acipenser oxyrinchus oxyrinchus]